MGRNSWLILLTLVMAATVLAGGNTASRRDVPVGTTSENLKTAYQSEIESQQRYRDYAQRADAEGYHQIAGMFRAIANGEEVHSLLIADQGGWDEPAVVAAVQAVAPTGTTRENLRYALRDQAWEESRMYPQFKRQAELEGQADAAQLFARIQASEVTHRAWFKQVLRNLDDYTAEGARYYVCRDCGAVFRSTRSTCPACSAPQENFARVF